MLRKIVLLLCLAFAIVAFGVPCFIIPVGDYDFREKQNGITTEISYNFGFKGKVKYTEKHLDKDGKEVLPTVTFEYYYKLKKNKIVLSLDNKFDETDPTLAISNMYRVTDGENMYFNPYACGVAIGVALLAGVLVCTAPNKRY